MSFCGRVRLLVALLCLTACLWAPHSALAAPALVRVHADELQSLTFSNLIVRVRDANWIGTGDDALRVKLLEHLRKRGYPALGAESLVFNKDKSVEARFQLGGTLTRAECKPEKDWRKKRLCRIGVDWELFNTREDRVVYSMTAWSIAGDLDLTHEDGKANAAHRLILGALDSLLSRPKYVEVLKKGAPAKLSLSSYGPASYRQCAAVERTMPTSASAVLAATVLVEVGDGFGSGTMISPDGLVLTAAHVVADEPDVQVRLTSGQTLPASLVRLHKAEDVALLYVSVPVDAECIPLRTDAIGVGEEVYAIGSPASKDFAFTLTRGIISGTRELEGIRYLQTDASVNPGNSGGPLIDAKGQGVGVVSWKVVAQAMEGLAFGVPVDAAQRALAVSAGTATDPSLRSRGEQPVTTAAIVKDRSDPAPSLDPQADRAREQSARKKRLSDLRWEATPAYVKLLKYGGLVIVGAGALGAMASWLRFDEDESTRAEFEDLRLKNDLSWAAMGLGAACTITGIILTPSVTLPDDKRAPRARVDMGFGVASGRLTVRY